MIIKYYPVLQCMTWRTSVTMGCVRRPAGCGHFEEECVHVPILSRGTEVTRLTGAEDVFGREVAAGSGRR